MSLSIIIIITTIIIIIIIIIIDIIIITRPGPIGPASRLLPDGLQNQMLRVVEAWNRIRQEGKVE